MGVDKPEPALATTVVCFDEDRRNSYDLSDEEVDLSTVIEPAVLSCLVENCAKLHGLSIALYDTQGALLCGVAVEGTDILESAIEYAGNTIGRLFVAGDSVQRELVSESLQSVVKGLVDAGFKSHLTRRLCAKSLHESYFELSEKNQTLNSAQSRLEEVEGLKRNFLATVSHELRTPLTSIIGYSDMLAAGLAGELNDDQQEFVKTILSKSDQLLSLITGILEASLLEAKSLRLKTQTVSLSEVIAGVAATLEHDLTQSSLTLSLPKDDLPNAIGDKAKLTQVVLHLLANAIKFSPSGGEIRVRISVGALSQFDKTRLNSPFWNTKLGSRFGLRVTVEDQGVGIPREKRRYIFDPFFQVDSGATRAYGGPGLGLSLAHSYVSAHGGNLWVEDGPEGVGSTFTFSTPAQAEELDLYIQGLDTQDKEG